MADKWVKADVELPEFYGAYICTGSDIDLEIVYFSPEFGWCDDYDVTHWRPCPEPPEV